LLSHFKRQRRKRASRGEQRDYFAFKAVMVFGIVLLAQQQGIGGQ
jgi:hypothetical protein